MLLTMTPGLRGEMVEPSMVKEKLLVLVNADFIPMKTSLPYGVTR